MDQKKIKVAVIGVGGISEVHINGYKQLPNVELYAFCDINENTLKLKGERHGVTRLYTDEATMLKELPEIDAVSVCTWNAAHAPCTIMALNAGKHVIDLVRYLMGKPMPVSVYGVTYDKLKNRPGIKKKGGYVSETVTEKPIFDVEDFASALIRFDNGATLSVEASFSLNIEKDVTNIELFGTKSGAVIDPEVTIYTEQNGYLTNVKFAQSTALSFDGLFEKEIAHFVQCVAEGTECRNPGEDGVVLMKILDAIYESARTGHEVIIGE